MVNWTAKRYGEKMLLKSEITLKIRCKDSRENRKCQLSHYCLYDNDGIGACWLLEICEVENDSQ